MRLILLLISCLMLSSAFACGSEAESTKPNASPVVPTTIIDTQVSSPTTDPKEIEIITVKVSSNPYLYEPNTYNLQVGKTYRFMIEGDAEFHTFTSTDLGVNVNVFAETNETVDIVASKVGTFTLICIPHELQGMTGTIMVQ